MATLEIYLEIGADGGCLIYTFDPPGILARGSSVEEAMAEAPRGARWLRQFLADSGRLSLLVEPWPEEHDPQLVAAETVRGRGRVARGGTRATYKRDMVAMEKGEILDCLHIMESLRSHLLAFRDRLSPPAYGYRSLPHRKTIEEQLRHIASCERWYLSRLFDDLPRLVRQDNVWSRLSVTRALVNRVLGGLSGAGLGLSRKSDSEIWTTRKVVRRLLYHDKFHLDTLDRDLGLFLSSDGSQS